MTHDEMIKRMSPHGYLRGLWYLSKDLMVVIGEACRSPKK